MPKSIIWLWKLYYSIFIPAIFILILKKWDVDNITILLEYTKESIELVYANSYKRYYYLLLAGFIVDYEEQVLIIGNKANMQYTICHSLLKEEKLGT